ncbi:transcription factor bHLH35-like isoform X1 [Zingiber officinale]|uniref:transcription factor bHLH35-like isoform X1 n=1 Tax=Zingiber officinale TaxID=94328 RepID=UPI001C4D8359|nr:transcription factor bHLH35-like isoform X1 [Zingiber officinale]
MDDMNAEYSLYWETKRLMDLEELESWGFEEAVSGGYYGSSSPEGVSSSAPTTAKNIAMERNRRKKLDDKLYALRSVVPKITKMNKASIIKDAIDYIIQLQDEERQMKADISELESKLKQELASVDDDLAHLENLHFSQRKKKRTASAPSSPSSTPIQVVELTVSEVGEKTILINITCNKKSDTMIKLCELFESLNMKIITANITCLAGSFFYTLFIESDEIGSAQLKEKIETAITELDSPRTMSSILELY